MVSIMPNNMHKLPKAGKFQENRKYQIMSIKFNVIFRYSSRKCHMERKNLRGDFNRLHQE